MLGEGQAKCPEISGKMALCSVFQLTSAACGVLMKTADCGGEWDFVALSAIPVERLNK